MEEGQNLVSLKKKGNRAEEEAIQGMQILILPINTLESLKKAVLVEQGSEGEGEFLEKLRYQIT